MISTLARGEMNTVILPVSAVVLGCMFLAILGMLSLIRAAIVIRASRDIETRDNANEVFLMAMVAAVIPLLMGVVCVFIYQGQGGFQ